MKTKTVSSMRFQLSINVIALVGAVMTVISNYMVGYSNAMVVPIHIGICIALFCGFILSCIEYNAVVKKEVMFVGT